MQRKVGPLPVWAWLVAGSAIVLYLVYRARSSSTQPSANTVDPSSPEGLTYGQEAQDAAMGIDPTTGQSFAQEQAAQLAGAGSDGGGTGDAGAGVDVTGLESQLADMAAAQGEIQNQLAQLPYGGGLADSPSPVQTFAGEVQDVTAGLTALQGLQHALAPTPPTATKKASLPALTARGAIRAPSGPTKPRAPRGYTAVGLGRGNWELVPTIARTVTHHTTPPKPTAHPKPEPRSVHLAGKKKR